MCCCRPLTSSITFTVPIVHRSPAIFEYRMQSHGIVTIYLYHNFINKYIGARCGAYVRLHPLVGDGQRWAVKCNNWIIIIFINSMNIGFRRILWPRRNTHSSKQFFPQSICRLIHRDGCAARTSMSACNACRVLGSANGYYICILILLLLFQLCCASYRSENRMKTFTLMKLFRYQFEQWIWPMAYTVYIGMHVCGRQTTRLSTWISTGHNFHTEWAQFHCRVVHGIRKKNSFSICRWAFACPAPAWTFLVRFRRNYMIIIINWIEW